MELPLMERINILQERMDRLLLQVKEDLQASAALRTWIQQHLADRDQASLPQETRQ
jgi:hypothetical protein